MKKLSVLCVVLAAAVLVCGCGKTRTDADYINNTSQAADHGNAADGSSSSAEAAQKPVTVGARSASGEAFEFSTREDGTAVLVRYNGMDKDVVIEAQYNGAAVTEIGQYAFEAADTVESVRLPDSVKVIGEFAFMDCTNLKSITLPGGVTTLNRGAFAGCSALTEFTLPSSVTKTSEELFTGCGLTDLYVQNPELSYENWGLEDAETKCTIHAPANAAVLNWAKNNDFKTAEE